MKLEKETSVFKRDAIKNGIALAKKKATDFLTELANGIFVHAEGTPSDPTDSQAEGVRITDTIDVIHEGESVANYGTEARIGSASSGNLLARSNGVVVRDGLTELAQFRADGMAFNDSAGNKVVDIDTGGGDVTRAFSKRMFEGVALYQDTPVTLGINHPYFSGDIAIDGHFYGILSNGNIAYTTIDDLSSDFSTTSDNVRIEYSAVAGQFTLSYTGSSEGVTVFRFVFAWKQQVPKTFFSFGWRWRERIAGIFSAIIGEGLQARYDDQVVVGKYNNNKSTNIFEVGIGTDDTVRRNGLEVTSDGDVYAYGKFKIGGGSDSLLKYYSVTTPATTIPGNSGALCQTTFTMPSPYTHVIGVRQVSSNHAVATGINTFGVDGDGASGNTITCHAYVRNFNATAITDETVTFELFLASL